jgi:hypothetical protein
MDADKIIAALISREDILRKALRALGGETVADLALV